MKDIKERMEEICKERSSGKSLTMEICEVMFWKPKEMSSAFGAILSLRDIISDSYNRVAERMCQVFDRFMEMGEQKCEFGICQEAVTQAPC